MPFWTAIIALSVGLMLTRLLADPGSRLRILDFPNERSLHSRPTPRTGGIAIVAGILAGWLLYALVSALSRDLAWVAGLMAVIAVVSHLDDRKHLSVGLRLAAHMTVALLLGIAGFNLEILSLAGLGVALPGWLAFCLTVLFAVWMINLYNFMDGMDGMAGGMALLGFGTFAFMGWLAGHEPFFIAALVVASAASGFLVFNFPPARIFMGDAGSSTLGFLAAALTLWGARDGVFPFWVALLVFAPFIVDATTTLARRVWRREAFWRAHKSHYYQQLVQAGWGHRKAVLAEYAVMLGSALSALAALRTGAAGQALILAGWALFYVVFFAWISRIASHRRREAA